MGGRSRGRRPADAPELVEHLGSASGAELIAVGAHPDDETLGLGRLIHTWARRQGPVTAVVATAGEACVDHVAPRPAGLVERRLAEWEAATAVLGVSDRMALGLVDGQLAATEARLSEALEPLFTQCAAGEPPPVLAAPWRLDPHPDHRAVGRVVCSLARRLGLPVVEFGVWMTYWSDPGELDDDGRRLGVLITDEQDERAFQQACEQYESQLRPLAPGWGAVVPPEMLAHLHEQLLVLPSEEPR